MNILSSIIILIIFCSNYMFSQIIEEKKVELSGTVSYNYSKDNYDFLEGRRFLKSKVFHVYEVKPSIAFEFYPYSQIVFSPFYNYQFSEYNMNNGLRDFTDSYEDHQIGFELGSAYNFYIDSKILLFAGVKIGFNWSLYQNLTRTDINYKWTKLRFSFPILVSGLKYFIGSDWALLLKIQYKYFPKQSGWSDVNSKYLIFGFGVASYL